MDGGNEWFPNSQRRAKELEPKKILFVGMGISGGEEGARNGPSLMPGGPKEAYDALAPIITKCAAQVRFETFYLNGEHINWRNFGHDHADVTYVSSAGWFVFIFDPCKVFHSASLTAGRK